MIVDHPAALAALTAATTATIAVIAQTVTDVGNLAEYAIGPITITGAIVFADRLLKRARDEQIHLSRATAEQAIKQLNTERVDWNTERAALRAELSDTYNEIQRLRQTGNR